MEQLLERGSTSSLESNLGFDDRTLCPEKGYIDNRLFTTV